MGVLINYDCEEVRIFLIEDRVKGVFEAKEVGRVEGQRLQHNTERQFEWMLVNIFDPPRLHLHLTLLQQLLLLIDTPSQPQVVFYHLLVVIRALGISNRYAFSLKLLSSP